MACCLLQRWENRRSQERSVVATRGFSELQIYELEMAKRRSLAISNSHPANLLWRTVVVCHGTYAMIPILGWLHLSAYSHELVQYWY